MKAPEAKLTRDPLSSMSLIHWEVVVGEWYQSGWLISFFKPGCTRAQREDTATPWGVWLSWMEMQTQKAGLGPSWVIRYRDKLKTLVS